MQLRTLAGNEGLKRMLSGSGRLPHALILSGPAGSGRHTAAREIAQAWVCSQPEKAPCGVCAHCRKVAQGIHPDVMGLDRFLEPGDTGKELRVYAVRALREDAQIRPNEAACKVYLIDRPMNVQAQNAMLKLLEEGPSYARFLMLTENSDTLLETVRSRCVTLHTTPLTEAQVLAYLRQRHPEQDENTLRRAAQAAEGLLGRGEDLLAAGQTADDLEADTASWVEALAQRDELALVQCVAALQTQKRSREQGDRLYAALQEVLHQALIHPLVGGELPRELEEQAARLGSVYTQGQLMALYERVTRAREMGQGNVSPAQSAGWLAVAALEV